jgi:DNA-binding transcriptional ArsR family regulator
LRFAKNGPARQHLAMPLGRSKKPRGGPADLLDALADPTRLLMLCALATGDMSPIEIARAIGEEVANVSFHLIRLKRAGLIVVKGPRGHAKYSLAIGERMSLTATTLEMTHASGLKVTLLLL